MEKLHRKSRMVIRGETIFYSIRRANGFRDDGWIALVFVWIQPLALTQWKAANFPFFVGLEQRARRRRQSCMSPAERE